MSGLQPQALLLSLGVSLLLTLLLELAFALLFRVRGKWDLTLVILANILTNPVVVLCHHLTRALLPSFPIAVATLLLEAGAVLIEGLCYQRYSQRIPRPYLFSLAANGFSYGMGVLISIL